MNEPEMIATPEPDEQMDFTLAKIQLNRLVSSWAEECRETEKRRNQRDVKVDVKALRMSKKLAEDETLIPVRVIDTNIQREQPAYVNYLKNSRRIATFTCLSRKGIDTQLLEQEFTRVSTYVAWELPHYKNIDGSQTHGWDAVEVVEDDNNPGGYAIEHVGHDKLFFPRTSLDIQFSKHVIRKYEMTLLQLEQFTKSGFGFSSEQVAKLKDARKSTERESETLEVYKTLCKRDGVVYVSWFSLDYGLTDWLKAPVPLDLGTGEQITSYPFFVLPYRESEKPQIVDHKGRCYYDWNKQEAQTAILSGYVNGLTRASQVYASPAKESGSGSSIKEIENVKLAGGRLLSEPINFWHPDYPDPSVLRALQFFDVSNSQEVNQVSFAAQNREDSRKTATEIQAANSQQQLLNSVQLTMFSTFIRQVYSFAWQIVRAKALSGKIAFLQKEVQVPLMNPVTQQPTGQTTTKVVNDTETLSYIYDLRAAGDVDVIQRQEKISQMMQDWPVISGTPLRDQFLQDLMRLKYPDTGDRYATLLGQQPQLDALKGLVGRYATIMQGMVQQNPEMMQQLPPAQQADVADLIKQGLEMVQAQ